MMPICTVDRKLSGLSMSFSAVFADELPFVASDAMLLRLDEISAISAIANIPFNRIRPSMMKISSMDYRLFLSCLRFFILACCTFKATNNASRTAMTTIRNIQLVSVSIYVFPILSAKI